MLTVLIMVLDVVLNALARIQFSPPSCTPLVVHSRFSNVLNILTCRAQHHAQHSPPSLHPLSLLLNIGYCWSTVHSRALIFFYCSQCHLQHCQAIISNMTICLNWLTASGVSGIRQFRWISHISQSDHFRPSARGGVWSQTARWPDLQAFRHVSW